MSSNGHDGAASPPPPPPWDLVDVFCGGGLFSHGARAAGMRVLSAVDSSADALSVYKLNFSCDVTCATVQPGCTDFALPAPRERLHVHLSPPCQELSNAKRGGRSGYGFQMLEWSIKTGSRYHSFSVDTVHTGATLAFAKAQAAANPTRVAYGVYDAVNFGAAQTRVRLLLATPSIIRRLNEAAVSVRVSVEDAFRATGVAIPDGATHIRNSSPSRHGTNMRPIQGPAFTCCASRALTFCDATGRTVLSMRPEHTAILMGLTNTFKLSGKQCVDQPLLGSGVVIGLARAIALAAMGREITPPNPAPEAPKPMVPVVEVLAVEATSEKRGHEATSNGGGSDEYDDLRAKLQRSERRVALLSELLALGPA